MNEKGGVMRTLDIMGELTIQTAGERKAELLSLLEAGEESEIVLAEVTELDTAGLQLLLLAKREAAHLGKTLHFRSPSQVVSDVLAIAHLTPALERVR